MDITQQIGQQLTAPKDFIVLKAGTVVKVGGFPFKLIADTQVEGHQANLNLAAMPLIKGAVA